jgi:hypothetical protein
MMNTAAEAVTATRLERMEVITRQLVQVLWGLQRTPDGRSSGILTETSKGTLREAAGMLDIALS